MNLATPTADQANRFLRTLHAEDGLGVAVLMPHRGQRTLTVYSLQELAGFLQLPDFSTVIESGYQTSINYVSTRNMVGWISDVLGDAELGEALKTLTEDGRAFGELVADMKSLLNDRVAQCLEVLKLAATDTSDD